MKYFKKFALKTQLLVILEVNHRNKILIVFESVKVKVSK